jgi:arsenical pump membrane protein
VFLAAVLVVAEVADALGLFDWAGSRIGAVRGGGRARFAAVSGTAVVVTTTLSLDATAALLTPAVVRMTRERRVDPTPYALATVQLANGASLALPVANLTNLLVWSATGLSFVAFASKMALPTLGAGVAITAIIGWSYRHSLADESDVSPVVAASLDRAGVRAGIGIGALLAAIAIGSAAGIEVAWVAAAGAIALGGMAALTGHVTVGRLARSIAPDLIVFVGAMSVLAATAAQHGLTARLGDLIPAGGGFLTLLAVAAIAAVLANLVNNVPATLLLLAALPHAAAATLLAILIGVNVGPNLTPTGSLATLLWRRAIEREALHVPTRRLVTSGLLTTPAALIVAVGCLRLTLG